MPTSKPERERGKVKKELKVQKAHYRFVVMLLLLLKQGNANRDSGNEEQPTCFLYREVARENISMIL